ncbi:MAG TPA: type II toxin-antitoxin system VapC family toxin [Chloroflexota bacterium]|nr:type II toxin-antitoxin system VapC family toxin [Chloroflexota bacterium]
MPIVLDASITLAWVHSQPPAEATHAQQILLVDDALVPAIWPAEVANGLLVAERRGMLTADQRTSFLALLRRLDIAVEATGAELTLSVTLNLARDHGLSVYDAMYLELARREGVPLATLDSRVREAATRLGITILEPESDPTLTDPKDT